jgi:hypothetical protein
LGAFYIEDGARGRRILPLGMGASDYLDVLIDPQASDEVVTALVDHVTAQRRPLGQLGTRGAGS